MEDRLSETATESLKWFCTVGVNSGYELKTQHRMEPEEFAARYRRVAAEIERTHGVYISATFSPSRVVYKEEWGCPSEGEYTYTLSGSCNPAFSNVKEYKAALLDLISALRKEFDQSTLLLEMVPAEVVYDREE